MGAKVYMPYEVDCTMQYADSWFYKEGVGYKSIVELAGQCVHHHHRPHPTFAQHDHLGCTKC